VADVFLVYDEHDRERAKQLAEALTKTALSVWWNPAYVSATDRADKSAMEFAAAACVVVLWSPHSVRRAAVAEKAGDAKGRNVLVSVTVERTPLPADFRDAPHADLTGWAEDTSASNFVLLVRQIRRLTSQHPPSPPEQTGDAGTAVPTMLSPPVRPTKPQPASGARTATLFLCYRRDDTQDAAGRLHDRLVEAYGADRVFIDIASAPLGIDYVDHVAQRIATCNALIVMIGKRWLTIKDKKRQRRLDDPNDLVRAETRAALQQNIPVIPVVVQNADMPTADNLPEDIRPLARRNGIQLRPDQWKEGVDRLLKELDKVMKK
jgi:hypothetical protein